MKSNLAIVTGVLAALLLASQAGAISTDPAAYAIVGENGVSMNTYSTCLGDIYSGGDLSLQFGYGIQNSPNAGNMMSLGNVSVGLLSDVTGNIYADGGVSLNGDDAISGNVTYGTSYGTSLSGNQVDGSLTQATRAVPHVNLPTATSFTPGMNDVTTATNLTLAPGSYGNVTENGLYQNVTLSSGNYYLKSLNLPEGGNLYLNVTNAPIQVFVQDNINVGSYLETYLNGQSSGTSSLASSVLFETDGNFNLAGLNIYEFYGTVFAPSGSVSLSIGQMDGSIMSSGSISAATYLTEAQYNWSEWKVNGGGTWSTPANWIGGLVPGANANDTATFGTALTAGTATVTLDSPRSLRALGFSTTGSTELHGRRKQYADHVERAFRRGNDH